MDLHDLVDHQTVLHEKHFIYDIEDSPEGVAFCSHEKVFFGADGPVTMFKATLHRLDCGHIVGLKGGAGLAGQCQKCGSWMCQNCGNRCSACHKLICNACTKVLNGSVYCGRCRVTALLKRGALFLLKGVHSGLSK